MNRNDEVRPAVRRMDGVDALRGVSILAVVLLHIWIRFSFIEVHLGRDWAQPLRQLVWRNGGNGVTVFFAVSGFLITLTSLRRFGSLGAVRPWVFYRIRFARIMPLLLLLLAVLSALHLLQVPGFVVNAKFFTLPRALVSALTFHLNWLEASRGAYLPACWTVLWSLSIEEMFYLFFPLVCVAVMRRGRWGVGVWFAIAVGLVAMGPFARTMWSHTDLQQENSYLAGMSDIAMGCMAAWVTNRVVRRGGTVRRGWLLLMQAMGWTVLAAFATWPRWPWMRAPMRALGRSGTDDTLLALGACLILAAVALGGVHGRWWSAPLRWLGRHSYEVYLSHEFVVMAGVAMFARWFAQGASRVVVAGFVVGILLVTAPLGWVLARGVGEPMNRWLRG